MPMTDTYQCIRYEVSDGIATLTYDRPDKLNAFMAQMTREIIDAFDRSDADDAVRAVIVTGAGRAFSAGADLSGGADTFADFSLQGDETPVRSEEHTSELQSLMRISYAVCCLKKRIKRRTKYKTQ